MKLEAQTRLKITAAPMYTKLVEIAKAILPTVPAKEALEVLRELPRATLDKAESFLQKDASTKTYREAIQGKSTCKELNHIVEHLEIYSEDEE